MMRRRRCVHIKRLICVLLIVLFAGLLSSCGCRTKTDTEDVKLPLEEIETVNVFTENGDLSEERSSEGKTLEEESEKASSEDKAGGGSETGYVDEPETGSEGEAETESEDESETKSGGESETESEDGNRYFGKLMDEYLLKVNQKIQSDPGAKVADLFEEHNYTAAEVLEMIRYYEFPEKNCYGGRLDTENVQNELTAYLNLSLLEERAAVDLEEKLPVRYGILTDNASLRSFPANLRAYNEGDSEVWDYFQETKLIYCDGVIILHETEDEVWSFVQGLNYYGWIETENIAFCEREAFLDYLTQDEFLVRIRAIPGDISPLNRLGVILPVAEKNEEDHSCTVILPERAEDGSLVLYEQKLDGELLSAYYHEGFLEYSTEALLLEARSMLEYPYGYGDLHSNYDCSSFAGLVYRCFGIFTPRNSGDMSHAAGLHVEDVTGYSDSQKAQLLISHPGAILGWPGHVMMSLGKISSDTGDHAGIIHCNTAYYDAPDGDPAHYIITEKVLEASAAEIYGADGRSFLTRLEYVIWLAPDTELQGKSSKE